VEVAERGGKQWPDALGDKIDDVIGSSAGFAASPADRAVPVGYQCVVYVMPGDSTTSISEKFELDETILRRSNKNVMSDVDERGEFSFFSSFFFLFLLFDHTNTHCDMLIHFLFLHFWRRDILS
jgi:hypothetical protein